MDILYEDISSPDCVEVEELFGEEDDVLLICDNSVDSGIELDREFADAAANGGIQIKKASRFPDRQPKPRSVDRSNIVADVSKTKEEVVIITEIPHLPKEGSRRTVVSKEAPRGQPQRPKGRGDRPNPYYRERDDNRRGPPAYRGQGRRYYDRGFVPTFGQQNARNNPFTPSLVLYEQRRIMDLFDQMMNNPDFPQTPGEAKNKAIWAKTEPMVERVVLAYRFHRDPVPEYTKVVNVKLMQHRPVDFVIRKLKSQANKHFQFTQLVYRQRLYEMGDAIAYIFKNNRFINDRESVHQMMVKNEEGSLISLEEALLFPRRVHLESTGKGTYILRVDVRYTGPTMSVPPVDYPNYINVINTSQWIMPQRLIEYSSLLSMTRVPKLGPERRIDDVPFPHMVDVIDLTQKDPDN